MPPSNSIYGERRELLDKLEGLPLRNFSEIDATPTTGITSLPTPHGDEHRTLDDTHHDAPALEPSALEYSQIPCPTAPRIKDLDSFTEGTGVGSFDFSVDVEYCVESPPTLNTLSLSLVPPQDTSLSIEMWREEVYLHSPNSTEPPSRSEESVDVDVDADADQYSASHAKRPRSIASDDVARRTRPRAQSAVATPYATASSQLFYVGTTLTTAEVRLLARPQLRRTRSLPLRPD